MVFKVWLLCEKGAVQKVKQSLEARGHLSKTTKVKAGAASGYMLIPTELSLEDEKERSDREILLSLGLETLDLKYTPEVVLEAQTSDPKEAKETGTVRSFVTSWLEYRHESLLSDIGTTVSGLLANCPRRWSVYQPMVLLPARSFQSQPWVELLRHLDSSQKSSLWTGILKAIESKEGEASLTHLAINSGIPLSKNSSAFPKEQTENILRSPSGLIMLYGDWGPELTGTARDEPSDTDFRNAFWVSTKQNGIFQTWAPRYTMFSRGNIKEKARILSFHDPLTGKTAARRCITSQVLRDATAVDLYAGIGYFAFSYAQIGIGTVLCWEINPWSVQGLRRGVEMNGWSYRIIKGDELTKPLTQQLDRGTKIVVFEESNEHAAARIEELRREEYGVLLSNDIMHVNCGFLPSSEPSWKVAWKILGKERGGWLHLHENIGVEDVARRRREIESDISSWAVDEGSVCTVEAEHVEYVKTFAPGVWHVVFDTHISSCTAPDAASGGCH